MKYNEILKRLIEARKAAGLSQAQVGVMVGLSTFASSFSDIERGKNPLTVERLLELVEIYGVSLEWVMTGVNPYFDPQTLLETTNRMSEDMDKIVDLLSMSASPHATPLTATGQPAAGTEDEDDKLSTKALR